MSHDPPAASDSLIALIQPYVDDELDAAGRARVEAVLAEDPALREVALEQRAVRQLLRDVPHEPAPQALRARVLLELDAVDRERASAAPAPSRLGSRLRALLRGGAVMVPAGATALALFLALRTGSEAPVPSDSPAVAAAPRLDGVFADGPGAAPGVRLVGARAAAPSAAPLPAMRELQVGPRRVLDRQDLAGGLAPGDAREYRGARYWLGRIDGRPAVGFESDGLRHTLTAADDRGLADDREFVFLLELGHRLRAR
jgi:anti-sigma factor RsiW